MQDYNIEFAHIYVDEQFGHEQLRGSILAQELAEKLKKEGKRAVSCVMIDDYNPKEQILDIDDFLESIKKNFNSKLDLVAYESDLQSDALQLIDRIDGKLKKSYANYVAKRTKLPCSLLVATWYLKRLGKIPLGDIRIKEEDFIAKKIVNVLPEKYRSVEHRAMKIIKNSPFADCVQQIDALFF